MNLFMKDLSRKMVFLGGPRQVGKTTLAQSLLKSFSYKKGKKGLYLNWDFDEDRLRIIEKQLQSSQTPNSPESFIWEMTEVDVQSIFP